jgi:hypothetical protein
MWVFGDDAMTGAQVSYLKTFLSDGREVCEGKEKARRFKQDQRDQAQPADKEQAQKGGPQSPGQPAGGE